MIQASEQRRVSFLLRLMVNIMGLIPYSSIILCLQTPYLRRKSSLKHLKTFYCIHDGARRTPELPIALSDRWCFCTRLRAEKRPISDLLCSKTWHIVNRAVPNYVRLVIGSPND
jgi:hypothetical protein